MIGTIINEQNSNMFLSAIPEDILPDSDVRIGVIDEESDTACGVLTAEAIGGHILAIRYIFVDEKMRLRGAGRELVNTLIEVAEAIDAEGIVCVHSVGNESDGVVELLASCGFARNEEATEPILGVYLNEVSSFSKASKTLKAAGVTIQTLSEASDEKTGEDAMAIIGPLQKKDLELLENITEGAYITLGESVQYTYEVMI